jgi:hypothetical protein
MAKTRKKSDQPTLPLRPPPPPAKPIPPQVGDRVRMERSEFEWKIMSVRSEKSVDLELPGTYPTRFKVDVDTLEFIQRVTPETPTRATNASTLSERVEILQRDHLQRLDDDIAVLTKFVKSENAPKGVLEVLETLSHEQHASWQSAVERIEEELMDDVE